MLRFLFVLVGLLPTIASASEEQLVSALQGTYSACVGIDDSLADLKKMAGINTAITVAGTGLGAGAVVAGVKKADVDARIQELKKDICNLGGCTKEGVEKASEEDIEEIIKKLAEVNKISKEATTGDAAVAELQSQVDAKTTQSKKLGNWRTGLLAGNALTNVAGAVVAGKNKVDDDLQAQIEVCKAAVKNLKMVAMQAKLDGMDVSEADRIVAVCGEFDYVDVSKINNRGKGAMLSSAVGATTGVAGTIASVLANNNKTGKNLDGAANTLAGASTVASGVATVFNATQISAIKKVATVATQCSEVLK